MSFPDTTHILDSPESPDPAERARIVRLCAHITGRPDVAEDLAQETFLEAWRHAERLRDPRARSAWLSGIARNVCLRWARRQGRTIAAWESRVVPEDSEARERDWPDERVDLEGALEREDLARLLDRALAALPEVTRNVLIARFIDELPHAEIARQCGVSEGVVAVRIHRGKATLRRLLDTAFRDEALAYGLVDSTPPWQETRVWCMTCGRRRLEGQFDPPGGVLVLRCPACCLEAGSVVTQISQGHHFHGITGYRAAVNRVLRWADTFYRAALVDGVTACMGCGRPTPVHLGPLGDAPPVLRGRHGVAIACHDCDVGDQTLLATLALALPEGRAFWRQHPRIRTMPERLIDADGHAAIVVGFEDVASADRFEVVYALDRYQVLAIYDGVPR